MSDNIPHVLILGGGFGGLSAANEIRKSLPSSQVKITVVDKKNWFMVGFAKLWIIKGTRTFENSTGSLSGLTKIDIDEIVETGKLSWWEEQEKETSKPVEEPKDET